MVVTLESGAHDRYNVKQYGQSVYTYYWEEAAASRIMQQSSAARFAARKGVDPARSDRTPFSRFGSIASARTHQTTTRSQELFTLNYESNGPTSVLLLGGRRTKAKISHRVSLTSRYTAAISRTTAAGRECFFARNGLVAQRRHTFGGHLRGYTTSGVASRHVLALIRRRTNTTKACTHQRAPGVLSAK